MIDDHVVFRRGLKETLAEEFRGAVFAEARNAEDALSAFAKRPWDIVLLDISLPGRDGFETLQDMRAQRPEARVLILSVHSDHRYAARAIQLGASGYISKDASLVDLLRAVRTVLAGKRYLSRTLSAKLAEKPSDPENIATLPTALSTREHEILLALAAGKSSGEIASDLSLSAKTVGTYKRRILNKLHVTSTVDLVRYVIDNHLS